MKDSEADRAAQRPPPVRKELLLAVFDVAVWTLAAPAAMLLRYGGQPPQEHLTAFFAYLPLFVAWRLLIAHYFGLYDFRHRLRASDHFFSGCAAALAGVVPGYLFLALIQLYYAPLTQFSRAVAMIDLGVAVIYFALSRAFVLQWLWRRGNRIRILLVGGAGRCQALAEVMRAQAPPLVEILGALSNGVERDSQGLPGAADVSRLTAESRIDQAVIASADMDQTALQDLVHQCDLRRIQLFLYPDLGLSLLANTRLVTIAGLPVVPMRPAFLGGPYRPGKRILDCAIALPILLFGIPICVAAILSMKMSAPGPAFHLQERVGRRGRVFRMWKLRTMVPSAEEVSGPVLAGVTDPRIPPVARVLRRFRVDEIPQCWNVLRGDMSLVGPRPERPAFVAQFAEENPLYDRRHVVRPGLTGLAQVQSRYDTDYRQKLRYDLVYINSLSLATDLRILAATVRTVLTGRGAR